MMRTPQRTGAWLPRLWRMAILRFMALHAAIGFGIAGLFMAALLLADPGGVGSLLLRPSSGVLPLALLWLFSGLTFGSVQIGAAVMLQDDR
jgi:hypothetical protein